MSITKPHDKNNEIHAVKIDDKTRIQSCVNGQLLELFIYLLHVFFRKNDTHSHIIINYLFMKLCNVILMNISYKFFVNN